jgi:phage gpG-like protein
MAIRTSYKDQGFTDAINRLGGLTPKDLAPEFRAVGVAWAAMTRAGWTVQADPYGTPWERLSRYTRAIKREKGARYDTILRESGEMRNSVRFRVLADGVSVSVSRRFDDGTDQDIHQFGTSEHPTSGHAIPARPMLPFKPDLPHSWLTVFEQQMSKGVERILFR